VRGEAKETLDDSSAAMSMANENFDVGGTGGAIFGGPGKDRGGMIPIDLRLTPLV